MSAIYRLLYLSRASRTLEPADLDGLLQHARERNRDAGLTGALLHYGGHFLQVLEGDADAVAQCFERIRRDDRHAEVQPLLDGTAAQRTFAGWAMRHVTPSGPGDRAVLAFLDQLHRQASPEAVHSAMLLMQRLAERADAEPQPG